MCHRGRARRAKEADAAIEKLDKDLQAANWIRKDTEHLGQTIRVYSTEPKPGQLKVEQIVITLDETTDCCGS